MCNNIIIRRNVHSDVYTSVRPGSIDPMTAVVQRVKGFAYYSLSFSRHNKNIKMAYIFCLVISSDSINEKVLMISVHH